MAGSTLFDHHATNYSFKFFNKWPESCPGHLFLSPNTALKDSKTQSQEQQNRSKTGQES